MLARSHGPSHGQRISTPRVARLTTTAPPPASRLMTRRRSRWFERAAHARARMEPSVVRVRAAHALSGCAIDAGLLTQRALQRPKLCTYLHLHCACAHAPAVRIAARYRQHGKQPAACTVVAVYGPGRAQRHANARRADACAVRPRGARTRAMWSRVLVSPVAIDRTPGHF